MIYSVTAKFDESKMPEFYQKLINGTIQNQKPDGREIISSMKRAKVLSNNEIIWSEKCYCNPPLKHERETVYDKYFFDIQTNPIKEYKGFDGESFMEYLKNLKKINEYRLRYCYFSRHPWMNLAKVLIVTWAIECFLPRVTSWNQTTIEFAIRA